jgi:hypothetical protein
VLAHSLLSRNKSDCQTDYKLRNFGNRNYLHAATKIQLFIVGIKISEMKKIIFSLTVLASIALSANAIETATYSSAKAIDDWTYSRGGWVFDHGINQNVYNCPASNASGICRYPTKK